MSGERDVPEKVHAELGASSAYRWIACPGSINLSRGLPNVSSKYADEGTQAHALAELCLRKGKDAAEFVGTQLEGARVSEEMAEHVQLFIDYARELMPDVGVYWVERKFSLEALDPPEPMFGTSDFISYDAITHTLNVVDLKYGVGVVVETSSGSGWAQLRYYALGALMSLDTQQYPVDRIVITIVQPRASHAEGPIRSETLTVADLMDFAAFLLEKAHATQAPDAPLVAGEHCRFCPASGICPAQRAHAVALAQMDFDVVPEQFTPPVPETLPPEVIGDMLQKAPILEAWLKDMKAHALRLAEQGVEVPGFKLVTRRTNRRWQDEKETARWLRKEGYADDEIHAEPALKSPAQIEKLVGKKNLPAELWVKPEGGVTLAPATDSRPALERGEEFAALPSGDE